MLAQDFHADGALSGDHVRIIERMNERELPVARKRQRVLIGLIVIIAVKHRFATQIDHRLHLDLRSGQRHDDGGRNTAPLGRKRHALCVIACRGADHAALGRGFRQMRNLVVGAANLEGEDRLQIFALEEHCVAEAATQPRGRLQRRFDGHVIDASLQDALKIVVGHRSEGVVDGRRSCAPAGA